MKSLGHSGHEIGDIILPIFGKGRGGYCHISSFFFANMIADRHNIELI